MAVDYRFQSHDMRAIPVGYKPTNSAALDFLANNAVDAVIVDYALRDGKSEPLMGWLLQRKLPFVVVTANKPEMRQWIDVVLSWISPPRRLICAPHFPDCSMARDHLH